MAYLQPDAFFVPGVDVAGQRQAGREIGSLNKLRDMARGFDFAQPNAGERFRTEGYKIDPLQTERDYGALISKFDERQLKQAAALREKAGREWLKIGSLPEQQRPIAWQQAQSDPELAAVFDEPYSPEAYAGKEAEFQSLDEALKAAAAQRKNLQIRTTLGLGPPGTPRQPQPAGAPPTQYRETLARYESAGGANTVNPNNPAVKGTYQVSVNHFPQTAGLPDDQKLDAVLEENARLFRGKNGRLPNDAEQYAYHWFGHANGQRVLTANSDTPIERIIGQKAADINGLAGQTAGQVRGMVQQRMGTGTTWTSEPAGSDLPAAGAPQGQPVQMASADTSPQAIFASLPQWAQADVLNSADDAEALQKIGKYAQDIGKPPQSRTRPEGDQDVLEEFRGGKWVEVSRAPRWKQESAAPGPFGSTAIEAQAYNIVSAYQGKKARGEQTTAQEDYDYQLAVRQLQQPKVMMGPDGNQYLINPEPLPQFGAQPAANGAPASPQPATVTPVGTGANKDVRAIEETTARVGQSISRYRDALNTYGEGPTKKMFSPNEATLLESSYNDLMLEAKELYKLGVLNGPDYFIITQTLTPPTSIGAAIVDQKTMLKQLDELENKLNTAARNVKSINAPQGSTAAAPEPPPPTTKQYVIKDGKLVPVQ